MKIMKVEGEHQNMSKKENKRYKMRYAGSRGKGVVVELPFNPHKGRCEACGKSVVMGQIRCTSFHHFWYAYQPQTVKENPILILENTIEVCYPCHQQADAIRALLYASPIRVAQVAELLRGEPREKFIRVLDEVSRSLKEQDIGLAKKILESVK